QVSALRRREQCDTATRRRPPLVRLSGILKRDRFPQGHRYPDTASLPPLGRRRRDRDTPDEDAYAAARQHDGLDRQAGAGWRERGIGPQHTLDRDRIVPGPTPPRANPRGKRRALGRT